MSVNDQQHSIALLLCVGDKFFQQGKRFVLTATVQVEGGLIGIINAFADNSYRGSNQVVIIHELMHTLGATDKYNRANMPIYPEGYAEPYRQPLYPQRQAEIMGGRIPLSERQARMPQKLAEVMVGVFTAAEINWPVGAP